MCRPFPKPICFFSKICVPFVDGSLKRLCSIFGYIRDTPMFGLPRKNPLKGPGRRPVAPARAPCRYNLAAKPGLDNARGALGRGKYGLNCFGSGNRAWYSWRRETRKLASRAGGLVGRLSSSGVPGRFPQDDADQPAAQDVGLNERCRAPLHPLCGTLRRVWRSARSRHDDVGARPYGDCMLAGDQEGAQELLALNPKP